MPETRSYTPPAGHHFLTPLYDVGVRLSTRETVWRSALVELMSPKDQDVLLDIGAGTGSLAPLLARKNAATRYFGIDPDRHAIDIARKKARRAGIKAEFAHEIFSADAVAGWRRSVLFFIRCLSMRSCVYCRKSTLCSQQAAASILPTMASRVHG